MKRTHWGKGSFRLGLVVGFLWSIALFSSGSVHAATNLIANPSLEIQSGVLPLSWQSSSWGTNNAVFTYPVAGPGGTSDKAARVALTSYTTGDAKWYFNDVAV